MTAVVMSFVVGLIFWANMNGGWPYKVTEFSHRYYDVVSDVSVGICILFFMAVICEWWMRRSGKQTDNKLP